MHMMFHALARTGRLPALIVSAFVAAASITTTSARFKHPGCLSTKADLQRMAAKVAAGEQPWKASWDKLVGNTDGFLDDPPGVQSPIRAGGGGENYIRLARDCAKIYQLALRYYGSGDKRFADKAVELLNAWAKHHKEWAGDTNVSLRAGIYGYQLACAAELLRDYRGWQRSDFRAFQKYMKERFCEINRHFLDKRHGTVPTHYWANWGLAAGASMMAIGVLCDDRAIFDEAVEYFLHGAGNESIMNAVPIVHPCGLGQWQESGRDQGHSLMGPQLAGVICEIAWNQGIDLYGAKNNRFLAGVEYVSKYNLDREVPFGTYVYVHKHPGKEQFWIQNEISAHGRGLRRPGWDLVYNHYVNRRGISAPWTKRYAETTRPEGGGFNYDGSSGGFDGLGFTTLTHSRDPIAKGAVPSALHPHVQGRQITLSWAGSAYARSYNVKRSTAKGGPFTTVATVLEPAQYHIDPGLTAGTTYYYVVSANNEDGESADSVPVAATADGRLHGSVIGTDGSFQNNGAGKHTVFDGSLLSYFDPPTEDGWVGLDLGAGVEAVVTGVRYCPRPNAASRMKGGIFQGSGTPDFSGDVVELLTIRNEPKDATLTTESIGESRAFRYLRYVGPKGGWCSVAEIEFLGEVKGLEAPAAPAGLAATPSGSHQIILSWNAVPGADKYRVKRLTPNGGPALIVENVTGTGYQDEGLLSNFGYRYAVSAINSAGESPDSPHARAVTGPAGAGQ